MGLRGNRNFQIFFYYYFFSSFFLVSLYTGNWSAATIYFIIRFNYNQFHTFKKISYYFSLFVYLSTGNLSIDLLFYTCNPSIYLLFYTFSPSPCSSFSLSFFLKSSSPITYWSVSLFVLLILDILLPSQNFSKSPIFCFLFQSLDEGSLRLDGNVWFHFLFFFLGSISHNFHYSFWIIPHKLEGYGI